MRSRTRRALALVLFPLAACGGDETSRGSAIQGEEAEEALLYGATPTENLRVVPAELRLPGLPADWEGARIAAISDLRLGLWEQNEEVAAAAVRKAVAQDPDLIVLLGGFVEGEEDIAALERVLAPLQGRPVLAVLGDRDVRSDSVEARLNRLFDQRGIQVLRNETASVELRGQTLVVAGVGPELSGEPVADQEWVLSQTLGGAQLLLTHNPAMAARLPERSTPLVLGGGTFCGPVNVPGATPLPVLSRDIFPGAQVEGQTRVFRPEGNVLLITCGTGYSFAPVRAGAPPEIVSVRLRGAERVETEAPDTISADSLLREYEQERAERDTV